ncbi:cysteine proteinase [Vararia minispora EC-137]|uniref:Cysteine proteinase n=1 Tax=Vararia minispora EC-137 TaxID=1314806 RepID=A0ACB8QNH5_9AGAM|nr:cysteine proteinase [Vararia minispora EC-137]
MSVPATINPSELWDVPVNTDGFDGDLGNCEHITQVFADDTMKARMMHTFRGAVSWRAQRMHDNIHAPKRRKLASPQCGLCKKTMARPFVCLQCSFAGCWKDEHFTEHLMDEGHGFGVDTNSGAVFCIECDDFIYEQSLDTLYRNTVLTTDERNTHFLLDKKRRESFRPWIPLTKDTAALETATVIPCQSRRGLLNLGQTCFLNVVLQSLVHNPLLRNYYLADKHNRLLCEAMDCTSCEMDKLFNEMYTSSPAPFGPASLLAATWRTSGGVSGYAQHDAHECFIALLNALHASSHGATEAGCACVVHTAFGGTLQSEVRCGRCANPSKTPEACFDISLGLGDSDGADTLAGCLVRFTQPEKLGVKEYACPKCGKAATEAASKRMSILKLPPILSFQFKRFEQTSGDKGTTRKINTPVRIPSSINMAPYTSAAQAAPKADPATFTSASRSSRFRGALTDIRHRHPGPEGMYEYDLFAVINHEGDLNTGHYTNFSRFEDEWYRFDDEKHAPCSLGSVLGCPVPIYMTFYVKRELEYRPGGPLAGSSSSVREATAEREARPEQDAHGVGELEFP